MEPTSTHSIPPGPPPESGPGSRTRRIVFFAVSGAAVVGTLYTFREVLAPFLLALVVAYVFAPVVDRLERVRAFGQQLPRWAAVLMLYVTLLGTLGASLAVGTPLMVREIQKLSREAPRTLRTLRDEWLPAIDHTLREATAPLRRSPDERGEAAVAVGDDGVAAPERAGIPEDATAAGPPSPSSARSTSIEVLPRPGGGFEVRLPEEGVVVERDGDTGFVVRSAGTREEARSADLTQQIMEAIRRELQQGEQTVSGAIRAAQSFFTALVSGIFRFFIMLMLSAYLLLSRDAILRFFRSLVRPGSRQQWDTLVRRIDKGLSGVVRGQLLICLVNGVLSAIGFYMAGLEYWPLLTLIATVLSIIPIFGAIISSIPAVIVGLQSGVGVALFVLAWIIGIHQVEANLLNPKIMGDAAKVHPVLVVFALVAGEHFFGIIGALLAVPVLSISQSLFLHFRELALGVPASASSPGIDVSQVLGPEELARATAEQRSSAAAEDPSA